MRLSGIQASHYRSLLSADIPIGSFNLFIGANASGKSTILDALRFLCEAVAERDFKGQARSRHRVQRDGATGIAITTAVGDR